MAAVDDLDEVVEQAHLALGEIVKGNPEPLKLVYSHQEDVTLANPFGPPVRGWQQAAATMERAASNYRDGEIVGFENVAKYVNPELAYIVEVERYKAKVGGGEELAPIALRVTSIFRREDGVWKIVHRHADPITTAQPAESVIQE
jgi:ketosteroid isomerase-like protein